MSDNRNYLPDYYTEVSEPFFEGRGNHSVMKLEEICEQYKEFTHQLQIKFQNASQQTASLREENERLKAKQPFLGWTNDKDILNQQREYWGAMNGIKQIQEEVERLTGWLIDVDKDFNCLTDSQRKALSSKESKPS